MPSSGYSTGQDITLHFYDQNGAIDFGIGVINFNAKQDVTKNRIKPIDSPSVNQVFYEGWSGSFDIERNNPKVTDYFISQEAAFYRGENLPELSITETISEADGSISQYIYTGVRLSLDDGGSFQRDSPVTQRLSFEAARKQKLS